MISGGGRIEINPPGITLSQTHLHYYICMCAQTTDIDILHPQTGSPYFMVVTDARLDKSSRMSTAIELNLLA